MSLARTSYQRCLVHVPLQVVDLSAVPLKAVHNRSLTVV
jgi:hypothetical protein